MYYNKFMTSNGDVFLDLSEDTVAPITLAKGVTAHNRRGEPIVGTMTGTSGTGLPPEIYTQEEMTALLDTAEVGSVFKYVGVTNVYENGALYIIGESE